MTQVIFKKLRQAGSELALGNGTAWLTYADLDQWSTMVATEIDQYSTHAPAPIGLLAPPSFEYAAGMLGIWRSKNITVPLQPAHPMAELEYIVRDTGLRELRAHPDCLQLAADLARKAGGGINVRELRQAHVPGPPSAATALSPEDGALIIYTSGTTSRPKGVVITHGNLDFQTQCLIEAWRWSPGDRTLNVLPLHHVHGVVNILCCALAAGATCELAPGFDAELVWNRIATGSINVFMAVPTIYSRLIQHWEKQDVATRRRWSEAARALRLMVSGSAALPLPVFEKWEAITGHRLLERYGMTEIGMAISNPYEGARKPGTVGLPLPGVQVRLAAEGLTGELEIRGPGVFRQYWNRPDATAQSFTADGWFKTGDVAELDADGYYRILGRSSQDIIKCGGYKISALEIESALLEHPSVSEAAVVGIPDAEWGERVAVACVAATAPPAAEAELREWLSKKLAHYKIPTRWTWTSALPRNAMGKIIKGKVRELF